MRQTSSDVGLFGLNSSELLKHGFLTDSPEVVANWRSALTNVAPIPSGLSSLDDIDKVEAIINSFSRGGGERPIYFMPLLERILAARHASGYCSDHVKIFTALARVHGLFVREVQNELHGFADFFSASRNKWIFVDPMYAVLATDNAGTYLSSLELRERRLSDLPVHFIFFGVPGAGIHSEIDQRFKRLYDKSHFNRYVLTFGNNVLTEASRSASLAWLPWGARQLLFYATKMKPPFAHLTDHHVDHREANFARRRVWVLYGLTAYFFISLMAYPLVLIRGRLSRALDSEGRVGKAVKSAL